MRGRHRDRPEIPVRLASAVVAVVALAAVLLPIVLTGGDDPKPGAAPAQAPTPASSNGYAAAPPPTATPTPSQRPLPTVSGRITPAPVTSATPSPSPRTPAPTTSRSARPTPTRPSPTPPPAVGIVSWVSSMCLGTGGPNPRPGDAVVQEPCGSALAGKFELRAGAGGAVALVDRRAGLCVEVTGAEDRDGAPVSMESCTGAAEQLFTRPEVAGSGGRWQLAAQHNGRCLDVFDRVTTAGGTVLTFGCHGDDETTLRNQSWSLR